MTNKAVFIQLALSFEEAIEQAHHEKTSFRVNIKSLQHLMYKKIKVSLKLSSIDQSIFCDFNPLKIYPATGAWGKQGWTIFELADIEIEMLQDTTTLSYFNVAPKALTKKYHT